MSDAEEFVTIARVLKPQGRIGEVLAELFTDFPERFDQRHKLYLLPERGERREAALEGHWFHKGAIVLKFAGVDSISDAEQIVRHEVQISREERAQLEDGSVYVSDLLGCEIFEISGPEPRRLGVVTDIDFSAGEAPLLETKGEREYLVPYVAEFVRRQDLAAKRIDMALPDGLLDLDAPLSRAEQVQQKNEADEARASGEGAKKRR